MQNSLKQFSGFVCEMNERAQHGDAQALADWAVQELSDTVGFDCAWYGWAQLRAEGAKIYAQSTHHLPDDYYNSWCEMSEQDLLAATILENPGQTAVYDRRGRTQTDGMIWLSDTYGLTRMATAMCSRPNRVTSFFLSSYRGGQQCRDWSQDTLDYLQCAVDHLSSAMTSSVAAIMPHSVSVDSTRSILVNDNGIGLLGLRNAREQFGSLWPEWHDDQLPEPLCDLIKLPGKHVLVDRQLIITCEPAPGPNGMNLHQLTLRKLTKFDLLTQREQEVARLLASGKSHKEAARTLGVAPATVRNQTQSVYAKLGVKNRAALALEVS